MTTLVLALYTAAVVVWGATLAVGIANWLYKVGE